MNLKRRSFLIIPLFILVFPIAARAAELYLDPSNLVVAPKDTFSVKVKIDVKDNECINSGEVILGFTDKLEFNDFSAAESFFSLWVERPSSRSKSLTEKSKKVRMIGGIPGGYCGQIPGDSGDSNILGEFIFDADDLVDKNFSTAGISISGESKIYLHDGEGALAELETSGANIRIDRGEASKDKDWDKRIENDDVLPEPFVISISDHNNRKFAAFSTTDKQTGIDRYEVFEARPKELEPIYENLLDRLLGKGKVEEKWVEAEPPYYLKDQDMKSVIKVRAVDKAGNKRVVEYDNKELKEALKDRSQGVSAWISYLLLVSLLVLILILTAILLKSRRKKRK